MKIKLRKMFQISDNKKQLNKKGKSVKIQNIYVVLKAERRM